MKKTILATAAALFAVSGVASADLAETKGGIKIKTDDGRFEASVGGRIQFDLFILDEDDAVAIDGNPASAFGSGTAANDARSSTYFRRIYLTLKGKAYGWNYKIEPDFAGNSTNNTSGNRDIAFQDVYLSHAFGPGEIIIGQIKPFRGMEELTSSNDVTLMERPYASAVGVFNGGSNREFQQGLFYRGEVGDFSYGAGAFDLRRDNTRATEGVGYNGRVVFAPLTGDGKVFHVGVSYSEENPQKNDTGIDSVGTSVAYAGRRGPSLSLGGTGGGEHAGTIGGELAGAFGPITLQGEYMVQSLDQADGAKPNSQDVEAFYVQASWFVTGESKPYKKADGVFGQPKPKKDFGAIELAARFDHAENKDSDSTCDVTFGTAPDTTTVAATKCEVQTVTLGANWYVNPNVRFMLNYLMGENDRGFAKDKPDAITARAQFSF